MTFEEVIDIAVLEKNIKSGAIDLEKWYESACEVSPDDVSELLKIKKIWNEMKQEELTFERKIHFMKEMFDCISLDENQKRLVSAKYSHLPKK